MNSSLDLGIDLDLDKEYEHRPSFYSRVPANKETTLEDFKLLKVIGRGTYGKVFLIEERKNPGVVYAMKSLDKQSIIESEQYNETLLEKKIMECIDHQFIIPLNYVFQTKTKVLFVMPFI